MQTAINRRVVELTLVENFAKKLINFKEITHIKELDS